MEEESPKRKRWRLRWPPVRLTWLGRSVAFTRRLEEGIGSIVGIVLKLGTLLLITILMVFMYRTFRDHSYVIKPFSVPDDWEAGGLDGTVAANRILDEVISIKAEANSVKEDSVRLTGNDEPGLDLSVMGIGLSLQSITYHLREIFGRRNLLIRGEVTRFDNHLSLTLRMTGFPPDTLSIDLSGIDEQAAARRLLRRAGEAIMANTDPYRLAVVCYHQDRFDESLRLVNKILENRPSEAHWAYLAWGSILEEQGKQEEAILRFQRAAELRSDFELPWIRLGHLHDKLGRKDAAIAALRQGLRINAGNEYRWTNLGWMLHRHQNYPAADSAFRQATLIAPENSSVWLAWVDSKFSRGDIDGAEALIGRIDHLIEDNASGYLSKGLLHLVRGDTVQALENVLTAFQLDPANLTAIQMGMRGAYYLKDYEQFLQLYRTVNWEAVNDAARQSMWNLTAMTYNLTGRHQEAYDLIQKAIKIDPTAGYPYSTLAETYFFTRQPDSCYHYLEKAFQLGMSPSDIDLENPPYPQLSGQERFRMLVQHYSQN